MVFNSTVHVKSDLLKKTKLSQKPPNPEQSPTGKARGEGGKGEKS